MKPTIVRSVASVFSGDWLRPASKSRKVVLFTFALTFLISSIGCGVSVNTQPTPTPTSMNTAAPSPASLAASDTPVPTDTTVPTETLIPPTSTTIPTWTPMDFDPPAKPLPPHVMRGICSGGNVQLIITWPSVEDPSGIATYNYAIWRSSISQNAFSLFKEGDSTTNEARVSVPCNSNYRVTLAATDNALNKSEPSNYTEEYIQTPKPRTPTPANPKQATQKAAKKQTQRAP